MTIDAVAASLRDFAPAYRNEDDLQRQIHARLGAAFPGLVQREVRLEGGRDRLDFLVAGSVAVEVKIDGTFSQLARQVSRYASRDMIAGVVAVVGRSRLVGLPPELAGKPVRVVHLLGAL